MSMHTCTQCGLTTPRGPVHLRSPLGIQARTLGPLCESCARAAEAAGGPDAPFWALTLLPEANE